MRQRILEFLSVATTIAVVSLALATVAGQGPTPTAQAGAAAKAGPALKTSWGEPDLQGAWDVVPTQIPLQRPAKYKDQEFFTDAQIAELDIIRTAQPGNETRGPAGTEVDVAGAYNAIYGRRSPTGRRTSLIVDPPDGRIPPVTAAVTKRRAEIAAFGFMLLENTNTCKNKWPGCEGGKYTGIPSPRRFDPVPYVTAVTTVSTGGPPWARIINRQDGPEEHGLGMRCMAGMLPDFTGYRHIVQSPGAVSISYDTGQGQGWERPLNITSPPAPHLPAYIRTWWGDSRAHWEGNTLVVDVTNFNGFNDFSGSTDNMHLIERWTRTGPETLEYVVTMDDPTAWTKPWTVKQEYGRLDDQFNRVYKEPRCQEGNYAGIGWLSDARAVEKAFAEGRGPDPSTLNSAAPTASANTLGIAAGEEDADPLN